MKKLFGFFLVGALLSTGAPAQQRSNGDVPAAVTTAFAQQFPDMKAKWEKVGDQYEARYKVKRQKMSAVYNADGSLAKTEMALKVSQLPLPIIDYMEQHYGGSIKEAARVTKANGQINYEASVEDREVVFDASCAVINEEIRP